MSAGLIKSRAFIGGAPSSTRPAGHVGVRYTAANNAYIQSDSNPPAGAASGKIWLVSFWVNKGTDGTEQRVWSSTSFKACSITLEATNTVSVLARNAANTNILSAATTETITADGLWHHVAISVDLADTGNRAIYIDGSAATVTWSIYSDDSIAFAEAIYWRVGSDTNGTVDLDSSISEFYLDTPASYYDLSTGLSAFRDSATFGPADLGADGSTPTGSQPDVYFSGDDTSFVTNKGGVGAFTASGTIDVVNGPRNGA